MEDCNVSFEELNEEFDFEIATCVRLLTKDDNMSYYDYIINIYNERSDWHRACNVKIADLKFNIKESESRKLNSYEKQRLDKYKLALYILEH